MITNLIILTILSSPLKCNKRQWMCHNKRECISYLNFCDFNSDCTDGSDEMECTDCYDSNKDCSKYINDGSCLHPDKFIFENCRMSCGMCKTSSTTKTTTTTTITTLSNTYTTLSNTYTTLSNTYTTLSNLKSENNTKNYHKNEHSLSKKNKNIISSYLMVIIIIGFSLIVSILIIICFKIKANIIYVDRDDEINNSEIINKNYEENSVNTPRNSVNTPRNSVNITDNINFRNLPEYGNNLPEYGNNLEEYNNLREYDNINDGGFIEQENRVLTYEEMENKFSTVGSDYLIPVLNGTSEYYSVIE